MEKSGFWISRTTENSKSGIVPPGFFFFRLQLVFRKPLPIFWNWFFLRFSQYWFGFLHKFRQPFDGKWSKGDPCIKRVADRTPIFRCQYPGNPDEFGPSGNHCLFNLQIDLCTTSASFCSVKILLPAKPNFAPIKKITMGKNMDLIKIREIPIAIFYTHFLSYLKDNCLIQNQFVPEWMDGSNPPDPFADWLKPKNSSIKS